MPARLTASWPLEPANVCQLPNAAAMPMLAAAGIVVTEIHPPISAPDLVVLRLSMPAAPAHTATMKAKTSGLEMALASWWLSTSKSSGMRFAASKIRVASTVAAIASGKPIASAAAERLAGAGRSWTSATQRRATGPTTIAPTTRISLSRKIPIAAMSLREPCRSEDARQLDAFARALVELLPDDRVGRRPWGVRQRGLRVVRDRVDR